MSFSALSGSEYELCGKNTKLYVSKMIQSYVMPNKATYKKLLELGCGTGTITDFYIEYFKPESFLGIDEVEHYLEYARENHSKSSIEIKYEKCDLNNMEELKEILKKNLDVDLVISSFVLHWVEDPIELFKTISSNLNPGVEHFHISVVNFQEELIDLVEAYEGHPTWKVYYQDICKLPPLLSRVDPIYPSKDFIQWILDQRFQIYLEQLVPVTNHFESVEMGKLFHRFLLPFLNFIPCHLREEFMKEFLSDSRKACRSVDDKVTWKYNLFLFHTKN